MLEEVPDSGQTCSKAISPSTLAATDGKFKVECMADELTRVVIWQCGSHDDADPNHLIWSRRLCNMAAERLRLVGAKATTVMRGMYPIILYFLASCS